MSKQLVIETINPSNEDSTKFCLTNTVHLWKKLFTDGYPETRVIERIFEAPDINTAKEKAHEMIASIFDSYKISSEFRKLDAVLKPYVDYIFITGRDNKGLKGGVDGGKSLDTKSAAKKIFGILNILGSSEGFDGELGIEWMSWLDMRYDRYRIKLDDISEESAIGAIFELVKEGLIIVGEHRSKICLKLTSKGQNGSGYCNIPNWLK